MLSQCPKKIIAGNYSDYYFFIVIDGDFTETPSRLSPHSASYPQTESR